MNIEKTADDIVKAASACTTSRSLHARVVAILTAALGPQPGEPLLTTHEVAKLLQVDASTIAKWMSQGKLTGFRTPGGHRRVRESDLRAFCERYQMPVTGKLAA
jgi:excisionase family DNA binding protein